MKIGILTYHAVFNFGANLQVLSTVEFIRKAGHIPVIINWIPSDLKDNMNKVVPKIQGKSHREFQSMYFTVTRECSDSEDIAKCINEEDIDGVIIGSDSVFNIMKIKFNYRKFKQKIPTTDHIFPNPFWASFLDYDVNIPVAGLSISSQNADYQLYNTERNIIGKHLKRFSYLSVRDNWTQQLVNYFTDGSVTPPITPDPVFSFNNNVVYTISKEHLISKFQLPEKYILVSFSGGLRGGVSQKWIRSLQDYSKQHGFTCIQIPTPKGCQELDLDHKLRHPISPLEWYYLIKNAIGYVGILMHPIVTAIHNNIPFYSFDYYGIRKGLRINQYSSKTYHIVKWAGLLENYHSFGYFKPMPPAEHVIDRLIYFDIEKCRIFSEQQNINSIDNMNEILRKFEKS